jgi:hypothetical protein
MMTNKQPDNTALVPGNSQTAIAEILDAETFVVPGMENVQPGELRIPRLQLVQAQSRMDGKEGHEGEWFNSVTGEFIPNPELLIIGTAKGRVMFPAEYNAENKPLCGSDDGQAPRPEYVGAIVKTVGKDAAGDPEVRSATIPSLCAKCPLGLWGEDDTPPACNEVSTFAAVGEDGMGALFQLRSTGMKNVPSLKTLIAANGVRRAIRLGAVKETNDSGTYAIATFTPGRKPDREWQKTALSLARFGNMAARNQRAVMDADHADQDRRNFTAGPEEEPDFDGVPW